MKQDKKKFEFRQKKMRNIYTCTTFICQQINENNKKREKTADTHYTQRPRHFHEKKD